MFGSRLKTWMENYIGRPKKKVQAEAHKGKPQANRTVGLILDSSESLTQSDTGISSSSQQVLSSSTTDYREGYSTATMDSDRSALTHCHTAISLPSPESAYSTGYSTDGTSPGATAPPEYYINIRTGKHYFPSPAPTPTSPNPQVPFPNLHSPLQCPTTSFAPPRQPRPRPRPRPPPPPPESSAHQIPRPHSRIHTLSKLPHPHPHPIPPAPSPHFDTLSSPQPLHFQTIIFSKSPPKKINPRAQCTSLKLFLKSPRETSKPKTAHHDSKNKQLSPSKPKKWFRQPFHKFAHRRTDPCDDNAPNNDCYKLSHLDRPVSYLPAQDPATTTTTATTSTTTSSTTSTTTSTTTSSTTSTTTSSTTATTAASPRQRNRIKTNPWLPTAPVPPIDLQPTFPVPPLMRNRSCTNTPLQNRKSNHLQPLPPPPIQLLNDTPIPPTLLPDCTDRSDEDLTLNEMMGTYNESYVYEKETDILSDSDPTDCEDYGTDSDADNAGDEQDSHDDELDFIDNASLTDSEDTFPLNTGRCTYHHLCPNKHPFLCNTDRRHSRKDSDHRRSLRNLRGRRERRSQGGRRSSKGEDEDKKKHPEGRAKPPVDDHHSRGQNLRKALLQRAVAKSVSKTIEGSAMIRRKGGGSEGSPRVAPVLVEGDEEADERYKELIEEAENMFETLRNSPVVNRNSRKKMHVVDGEGSKCDRSGEMWKERQGKGPEKPPRKNTKNLALALPVDATKNPGGLETPNSSFKARSSAHSPLDPLGPSLRNFSVFQPAVGCGKEVRRSSSDDSEPSDAFGGKGCGKGGGVPSSPLVPIAFQSFDLGKPLTSYCPQSEPVKRKVYSCSTTYDRLVKHLEHNPAATFEDSQCQSGLSPHRPLHDPPPTSYRTMANV